MIDTAHIKDYFKDCVGPEDLYTQIMSIGKDQPPFPKEERIEENLVKGCQSLLWLSYQQKDGKLFFKAYSEALISAGLAQLLVLYYSGKAPHDVLKLPPTFIEELGIPGSLTPSRANGLYSVHLKMKQIALEAYMRSSAS